MKTYRVTASYSVYCYATVEAENPDDAYYKAVQMDGGDFKQEADASRCDDWYICSIKEITSP
jgi:hypothetical protein